MTTMFRRKQRRNPLWLVMLFRRIGNARHYRRQGMTWFQAWDMAAKVIN